MRRTLALAIGALLVTGCIHQSVPSDDRMADTVSRLEQVFPTLADLQIAGFRDQDWCRFIDSPRGGFTNHVEEDSTCNLFSARPQAFDDEANAEFDQLRQAFRDAGVSVQMVWNIDYDADGQIESAEFDMNAGLYDRFEYLYDRHGTADHTDTPDTIVNTQIDESWWFVSEDWN